MEYKNKKEITRRDFLKMLGGAGAATVGLAGCGRAKENVGTLESSGEIPTDRMTYRTNPTTGDRVSILGYGCMRWPTRAAERRRRGDRSGRGQQTG